MKVPTLDRRFNWSDSYLERKLKQARASMAKASGVSSRQPKSTLGKVIRYLVFFWAARMGLLGMSTMIPLLGSLVAMFHGPARSGLLPLSTFTLAEAQAKLFPEGEEGGLAAAIRGAFPCIPVLIRNISLPVNISDMLIADIDYTSVKLLTPGRGDTKHGADQPLLFSYFDRAAAWADERLESNPARSSPVYSSLPRYRSTSSLEEVVGFPFSDSEVGDEFVGCDGEPYCPLSRSGSHVRPRPWHITQPVTPLQASKLAPIFPALLGGLASQAAFRLWLGRENVSVAPHYDIEDNWYMQLHGQKTFLLTSAEGFRFFRPHSVLHPSWRQAQRDYLRNVRSLEQAIHEVMVSRDYESADSLARSSGAGGGGGGDSGGGESTSPVASPTTTIPSSAPYWSAPPVRIWSVTLHPGDLLFLPAFTFHTVTTGRDSASLSAWVPSAASTLYQDMRRMVPLPGIDVEQDLPEVTEVRLAQLGIAMQAVLNDRFVRGGYTQAYIKRLWSSRHRKSASERAWCDVPGPKDAGQCTPQSIAVADSKDRRLKTLLISQTLMAVLQSAVSSRELDHTPEKGLVVDQAAVRLLLVLDWAEEAIHELLQPVARSSPCAVMRFIETCVKWN